MSSVSTPAVPHSIPSISSSRDLQQPCGDWRLNTSSRTLGADTLAPAHQDGDTPRKETFSSRDDLGVAGGSLAGCERAVHSSREVQILTVGRTGAERRQACAARWGRLRRSRIGALEARSPRMDGRVVREPRRVVNPEKKKNRSPPSGQQRWLVSGGIRENPASRGTETSAEVLVGPPLGAGGWSETPVKRWLVELYNQKS